MYGSGSSNLGGTAAAADLQLPELTPDTSPASDRPDTSLDNTPAAAAVPPVPLRRRLATADGVTAAVDPAAAVAPAAAAGSASLTSSPWCCVWSEPPPPPAPAAAVSATTVLAVPVRLEEGTDGFFLGKMGLCVGQTHVKLLGVCQHGGEDVGVRVSILWGVVSTGQPTQQLQVSNTTTARGRVCTAGWAAAAAADGISVGVPPWLFTDPDVISTSSSSGPGLYMYAIWLSGFGCTPKPWVITIIRGGSGCSTSCLSYGGHGYGSVSQLASQPGPLPFSPSLVDVDGFGYVCWLSG